MRHAFPVRTMILAALILCLTGPGPIGTSRAEESRRIVMFMPDTDWPPYVMSDPAHPGGGVLMAVFRAVAEPMGYEVRAERIPNQRGWLLLDRGEVDVHAKAMEWVKNPDDYLWTDPFMTSRTAFILTANNPLPCATPADLYGKSLGAIKGFIYPELEEHFGPGRIERVDVASPFTLLDLLALGRVDAALVNMAETQWLLRNDPALSPDQYRLVPTPGGSAEYRFVFTRDAKWEPFIREFNRRLAAMKEDGSLEAILNSYR